MAQWVNRLLSKPGGVSSVPGTHVEEERENSHYTAMELVPLTSRHSGMHTYICIHTHNIYIHTPYIYIYNL